MKKYRKLLAAAIGLVVLFVLDRLDITIPGVSDMVLDMLVSAAVAFGVYQVPNEEPEQ